MFFHKPAVINFLFKLKFFDPKKTLIISSEPRSGSTWLFELLLNDKSLIPIWEPFHPALGNTPFEYKNIERIENEEFKKLRFVKYLNKLFKGVHHNKWTLKFFNRAHLKGNRIIIKSVRSNLLVKGLEKHFDLIYSPLILIRNPLITAISIARNFREFNDKEVLDSVRTWCITYADLLSDSTSNICYYENLVLNPDYEFKKIIEYFDLKIQSDIDFHKPSKSDFQKTFYIKSDEELQLEIDNVPSQLKESVQKILDQFGIVNYSAFSALPIISFNED